MANALAAANASCEIEHVEEPSAPAPVVKLRRFPDVPECTMPVVDSPCTRTECRYHLAHRSRVGEHRLNPTRECALEVANEGPHTMEQVAEILGISRQWVRKIEESALEKLRDNAVLRRIYDGHDE